MHARALPFAGIGTGRELARLSNAWTADMVLLRVTELHEAKHAWHDLGAKNPGGAPCIHDRPSSTSEQFQRGLLLGEGKRGVD